RSQSDQSSPVKPKPPMRRSSRRLMPSQSRTPPPRIESTPFLPAFDSKDLSLRAHSPSIDDASKYIPTCLLSATESDHCPRFWTVWRASLAAFAVMRFLFLLATSRAGMLALVPIAFNIRQASL